MHKKWVVPREEDGVSIIEFLLLHLESHQLSRRKIKEYIDRGFCSISRKIARRSSEKVTAGDVIQCLLPGKEEVIAWKFSQERILFEDKDIFAYDKPYGISSDPEGIGKLLQKKEKVHLVHRLDKGTSGVLLFAKNRTTFEALVEQFRERKVEKEYIAIVDGVMKEPRGTIKTLVGPVHRTQGKVVWGVVFRDGVEAYTDWVCVKKGASASLVELFPQTGRTHQLRVHMSFIKHPILGDRQYGLKFCCPYEALRQMLHAKKLSFFHPTTQEKLTLLAPLPQDMERAIKKIFPEK